uniref:RHS repeat-associated core domain-containing protein n=1 Tax=Zooshikella ganghwensis TaxID=202772 RepID=UPI0005707ECE
ADALGNITQQQYGNGATTLRVFDAKTGRLQDSGAYISSTTQIEDLHFAYDELGNLTQREDKRQKIHETFAYDQLNRLTEVTAKLSSNTLTTSVQYDALGNITHKSDVGDYQYADKCGSQQAGPHALTKTTGSQNATYCYDANGNMTSGNGRTVRYTAFDKPDQIIRGDYQIDLVYGPDQKRVRRIDQGPTGTSTTYYQSGIYEKVVSDTGKIQHKHYIGDVAIITKTENAGTEEGTKTNYFHHDHLSSITAITDQNGQVIERFSYDPWGKRRQTDWQAAIDFTQITSTITKRGFTDHEHLDGVGLIHMNGRVYDPNVGRFLSADPFIQFESNLQSYNRYSYGFNNPLNGSDPTGFIFEWLYDRWESGNRGPASEDYSFRSTLTDVLNESSSYSGEQTDFDYGIDNYVSHNMREHKLRYDTSAAPFFTQNSNDYGIGKMFGFGSVFSPHMEHYNQIAASLGGEVSSSYNEFQEGPARGAIIALGSAFGGVALGRYGANSFSKNSFRSSTKNNLSLPSQEIGSPYFIRINPISGKGPMAIDTSIFKSGKKTMNGGIRNSKKFWSQWKESYSNTLSPENIARINAKRSPVVDSEWIKHFPEHEKFLDETIIHHHLDYGPDAIPLPNTVHAKQPGWGIWHPQHSGQ